jgi:hypothetical protein
VVGLTYVAVSRVKSLSGVLFEPPFDLIRFKGTPTVPTHTETMRLADKARRFGIMSRSVSVIALRLFLGALKLELAADSGTFVLMTRLVCV